MKVLILFVLVGLFAGPACAQPMSYQQPLSAGRNLVSLGLQTAQSPQDLFGPGLRGVRAWDPVSRRYFVPAALTPGVGYWVDLRAAAVATVTGSRPASPHAATLARGWNHLGNPFPQPTAWGQIVVRRGAMEPVPLSSARTAGWIGDVALWNGRTWAAANLAAGGLDVGQGFRADVLVDNLTMEFSCRKAWTVLLYLVGENGDMEHDYLDAFQEMVALGVGSTDSVDIVVQFDRPKSPDPRFGGWPEAHRFHVTPGMEPIPANAVADWGDGRGGREVPSDHPATLADFLHWAAPRYPADNVMLVVADHGFGWQGLCIDDTSHGDYMMVRELAGVLAASPVRIDVLAFDACLMQGLEVAWQLKDCPVGVIVGSEAPGRQWPLAQILQTPARQPSIVPEDYARRICDLYVDSHAEPDVTLSALRTACTRPLGEATQALAAELTDGTDTIRMRTLAQDVMRLLDEAIIHERHGESFPMAGGLTIAFHQMDMSHGTPGIPEIFTYDYVGERTDFAARTPWRHMLSEYYNLGVNPAVYRVRSECMVFDSDQSKIDLYDFCRRLAAELETSQKQ